MNCSPLDLMSAPAPHLQQTNSVAGIVLNNVLDDGRVQKTARFALKFGARSVLYGMTAAAEGDTHELDGVEIVRIPNPRFSMEASAWPADPEQRDIERFCRVAAKAMAVHILRQRPMLLHSHDMYGLFIGAYCQAELAANGFFVPWVHDIHEYTDGLTTIARRFQSVASRFEFDYILQPDHLTTVCEPIATILSEKYHLTAAPTVVLNCPPREYKGKTDIRSALGLGPEKRIIVYSGGLGDRQRGVHTLVEALRHLPSDVVVVVVCSHMRGIGTELQLLSQDLRVADRLYFHPYVLNEELTHFLSTADLGCHPMVHFPNGEVALPNKLFEYLHARLPVIVSDVAEMKRFVQSVGVGLAFEAENPEELAGAVMKGLERREEIRGRISPELLDTYSWESQEQKLREIYRRLTERQPSGAQRRAAARDAIAASRVEERLKAHRADEPVAGTLDRLRIFHGPMHSAGQPYAMASAQRAIGLNADHVRIYNSSSGITYPAHRSFLANQDHSYWAHVARILHEYDIVHLYARSLVQKTGEHRFPSGADLMMARACGIPAIMHFQGSEVRTASRFREKNPFHWFDEDDTIVRAMPETAQIPFINLCRALASRMVVIDPELQSYVPDALIIERAIDLQRWKYVGPVRETRPLVVHAPSNRLIKGTDYVLKAVEELRSEGEEFDFQLIENLPNDRAKVILEEADIVIDQLRIGWYGVLACEAMALGKPVLVYIREDLLDYFQTWGCPFALSDPTSVKENLRVLVRSHALRKEIAVRGRHFAENVHDSKVIARKSADLYEQVLQETGFDDVAALVGWYQFQEGQVTRELSEAVNSAKVAGDAAEKLTVRVAELEAQVRRANENARSNLALAKARATELERQRSEGGLLAKMPPKQVPTRFRKAARATLPILRLLRCEPAARKVYAASGDWARVVRGRLFR